MTIRHTIDFMRGILVWPAGLILLKIAEPMISVNGDRWAIPFIEGLIVIVAAESILTTLLTVRRFNILWDKINKKKMQVS